GVSGRNSFPSFVSVGRILSYRCHLRHGAPSLVSAGGMVPHHWKEQGPRSPHVLHCIGIVLSHVLGEEWCPIIGVSGRNGAPSLVSAEEWCPVIGASGRNGAPSLVPAGGMVPRHWCQREEWCPVIGVSGRNGAPSLVSLGGIVPHHWCQREEW
ncbi:unnamed protein product, partial [Staurois parvus]